jgi:hypothetical protein
MEIHAPHGSIGSVREFLVHLAIITIGVLIALSLEGCTEWVHHRSLVREARAHIASELRVNKAEIDRLVSDMSNMGDQLEVALKVIEELRGRGKTDAKNFSLTYHMADLTTASRDTAEATGAFGYMDYAQVKRYAAAYDLQGQFVRQQERLFEAWVPVLNATHRKDLEGLTPAELDDWKRQTLTALSYVQVESGFATALSRAYESALKGED